MFIKTSEGRRINSTFVVKIDEIERQSDGKIRCLLVLDGGEELEVVVSADILYRLDNGA